VRASFPTNEKQTPPAMLVAIDFIITVTPLALGSSIYLLYRPKSIIIFRLVNALGANHFIDTLRQFFQSSVPVGRGILLYSVPEGMWAFSFIYVILWIWRGNVAQPMALVSIFFAVIVIEGSEIAQLSFLQGTFDLNDVVCNAVAIALAGGVAYARQKAD
jgi:hypothetical protein